MRKLIVGLWTCLTVAVAAVDGAEVIPDALYAPDWERPVWVRADRALTPGGTVDSELFDEDDRLGILPTDAAAITVLSRGGRVSLPHLFRGKGKAKGPTAHEDLLRTVRHAAGAGR